MCNLIGKCYIRQDCMYKMSDNEIFFGLVSISVVKLAALSICRYTKLKKFEKVGTVKSINLFPLKCAGPVHPYSATCTKEGLRYDDLTDRHWMCIQPDGALVQARAYPKLVLIRPTSHGDTLHLDAPGMPTLILPKNPEVNSQSRLINCRLWDEFITGLHCGPEADKWIRNYIGLEGASMVVTTAGMDKRESCDIYRPWENIAMKGDITAFPNTSAYMILSEGSVEDLNSRVEKKVTPVQFRPNLVISGCAPFDEDKWSEIKIGDNVYMRMIDLCSRCSFVNVDPCTGKRDDVTNQPLKTLRTYRNVPLYPTPCFGVNGAVDIEGEIKVGDHVYVIWKNTRECIK